MQQHWRKADNRIGLLFIAPFVLDPNEANRILAGGSSLWRSNNVKSSPPTWAAIKTPSDSFISAVAVAPGNSNVVWVGHNNGKIFKTSNATAATIVTAGPNDDASPTSHVGACSRP